MLLGLLCSLAGAQNEAAEVESYLRGSTYGKMTTLVTGDPLASLRDYAALPKAAGLPGHVLTLAGILVTLGFALSLWRAATTGREGVVKGAFVNMIVTAALLGACFQGSGSAFSFSAMMFSSWGSAYDWSRRTFAPDMDARIAEAQDGMYALMSQVVASASLVAVPGGTGVALRSAREMSLAAKGEKLAAGRSALGRTTALERGSLRAGGAVLSKMNLAMTFLNWTLLAYGFVVTVSGLLVLGCVYVLPLALAAVNFGNARVLWSVFGTFLASWFTVLLLPLFLAVALDKTFVEPAKAMQFYTQELALKRGEAREEARSVAEDVQRQAVESVAQCERAPTPEGLAADPCADVRSVGWIEKLLTGLTDTLTQKLGVISDLFNSVANTVASAFWGLSIAGAGLVISIGLMLGTPGRFAALLGGVAENLRGGPK